MSSFQPTLPARGATRPRRRNCCAPSYFNPRSPHGERQTGKLELHFDKPISTHAPRTGSDPRFRVLFSHSFQFQPTLPARGATIFSVVMFFVLLISTHAPRTGSDLVVVMVMVVSSSFQPTLPHGERLYRAKQASPAQNFNPRSRTGSDLGQPVREPQRKQFQPTLPHGERPQKRLLRADLLYFNPRSRTGSDDGKDYIDADTIISTHAPARGATHSTSIGHARCLFQPTLPHGERLCRNRHCTYRQHFNPRSRTGSDSYPPLVTVIRLIFQPTLPHGERRIYTHDDGTVVVISTHAPARGAT